jgi:NADPH-dependent curcumin reductase CurA
MYSGTGLFAVQLAKLSGAHVIGTCSADDKGLILTRLGCDRVVNYKKESLEQVLRKEYPKGVDVVYESVGGEFFDVAVRNLATKGRLIIIGVLFFRLRIVFKKCISLR